MSTLARWLGGPPLLVLAKLIFISLVVGAIMAGLGLTPRRLVYEVVDVFQSLFGVGLDAIRNVSHYILMGAVIVLPIWLVARLVNARR